MPAALAFLWLTVFSSLLFSPDALSPSELSRLEAEKNLGLAALEEGDVAQARRRFEAVRRLAPAEPLGWADGAIAAMRAKDHAQAKKLLAEASRLAAADSRVLALEGTLRELEGDSAGAVEAFEKAAAINPKDLPSRWSAARLAAGNPGSRQRSIRNIEAALEQSPANLFLLARLCEQRREEGNRPAALSACDRMGRAIEPGDAKLEKYLGEAKAALESGDAQAASLKYRVVENLLRATPRFQQARRDVEPGVVGLPLEEWSPALAASLRARPRAIPVRFSERPVPGLSGLRGLTAVRAAGKDGRDLVFAGQRGLVLVSAQSGYRAETPLPGSASRGVEVADVTNSGELDLVTPGALWVRGKEGWRKTEIASADRVLPLDYDSDGDLDLSVSSGSGDRLLRNNLDGTWTDVTASALPAGVASRWAAAADFDRDGDPDLVLASSGGGLLLLDNLRGGRLAEKPAGLPRTGNFLSVTAGDLNADGRPDLVWTTESRAFVALNRGDGTFLPAMELPAGGMPLLFDFDNDGHLDLFLAGPTGSALFRNDGAGAFTRVEGTFPAGARRRGGGLRRRRRSRPRPRHGGRGSGAPREPGRQRERLARRRARRPSDGLGQGQPVRVRLGSRDQVRTALRLADRFPPRHAPGSWLAPEGRGPARRLDQRDSPESALAAGQDAREGSAAVEGLLPLRLRLRRKGAGDSSPTSLGRSPAGLLYDGVHQAPADTREWLVVPGRMLRPSGGRLSLDFTEELWEAAYFDLAELRAVDHPAGVELVAEREDGPAALSAEGRSSPSPVP